LTFSDGHHSASADLPFLQACGSSLIPASGRLIGQQQSVRPGEKGTFTLCPAFFAASSTPAQPPRTITSASETFFPPDSERLNSF